MKRLVLTAFIVSVFSLPASAVIVVSMETTDVVPLFPFTAPFFELDNAPLTISGRAYASSLFAGQGWGYTAKGSRELAPWEFPVGTPAPGVGLALLGQYTQTPPGSSPAVDTDKYQNVLASAPPGLRDRFGGAVDNYFYGVTSILFNSNINVFSLEILDSGRNKDDGLGGPLHFAFYSRDGTQLQVFDFSMAKDIPLTFSSSAIDIAGVQIWHQDTLGMEFRTLRFGVPTPGILGLMLLGLAGLAIPRACRT